MEPIELKVQELNHQYSVDGPILEFNAKCFMSEEDWNLYRETIPWHARDWPWKLMLVPVEEKNND